MAKFEARFRVGWGDVDANGHMANTAFLNHAADARVVYFTERGFPATRFATERVGPVMARDELVYRRELRLSEEFTVDLVLAGLSADGIRFRVTNTFRDVAGEFAAKVVSEGVWFDLDARRPRLPPPELGELMRGVERDAEFVELPSRTH